LYKNTQQSENVMISTTETSTHTFLNNTATRNYHRYTHKPPVCTITIQMS